MADFPMEKFAGDDAKVDEEGGVSWGPFSIYLRDKSYTYSRKFGQPPRVCMWQYRGGFELRDGRWEALPPQVQFQALVGE
jgi:hypothetical protein